MLIPTPLAMPHRRPEPPAQPPGQGGAARDATRVENPLVYRTVLRIQPYQRDEMFAIARACFTSWLESKELATTLSSGVHHLTGTYTLTVTDSYDSDGHQAALRLRLRENKEEKREGTWQTTLTSAVDREAGPAYVGVDLEHYPSPGAGQTTPCPPRLVRELLDQFDVMDGSTRLSAVPHATHSDTLDLLLAALTDPARELPLVVAAVPSHTDTAWERLLTKLAQNLAGIASVHRLERDAAAAFAASTGDGHNVFAGQIRTYLPGVVLGSGEDGRRHRLLTYRRLSDPQFRNADTRIARYPRLHAVTTPQPELLSEAAFPGIEEALKNLRAARSATARTDGDETLESLRRQLDSANQTIDKALEELSEAASARDLAERSRRALDQERKDAVDRYEDEIADHDATQSALSALRHQVSVLQQRLVAAGRADDAYTPPVEDPVPMSFAELGDRAPGRMRHLILTYDVSRAADLDDDLKSSTWASKVWDALLALDAYGGASTAEGGFEGTFRDFCEAAPQGLRCYPSARVAMVESDTVRKDKKGHRRQRIFRVPPEVDPSGELFMEAHIKIDSKGRIAPRVYFYDDTAGATGKVIVGYIGRHLSNTRTN
ncbi:PspA/IM30 family protein [Streptomyces lavendulocolor]|uniref:PspA/IM30 family protein n=1 Tax=Streptomyces lavendulocolor TaxID=67316 RepID=UPI003C2B2E52